LTEVELIPKIDSLGSAIRYGIAIGLHGILFLALFFILRRTVFAPLARRAHRSERLLKKAEEEIEVLRSENNILLEEYEGRMEGANQLAVERREVTRMMGQRRADMILGDVKRETRRDLKNVVKKAEASQQAVLPVVSEEISSCATKFAEKIIES